MTEEGTKTASKISHGGEEASDEAVGSGHSPERSAEEADAARAAVSSGSEQPSQVASAVSPEAKGTEPAAAVEGAPSKPAPSPPSAGVAGVVSPASEGSGTKPTVPEAVEAPSKPEVAAPSAQAADVASPGTKESDTEPAVPKAAAVAEVSPRPVAAEAEDKEATVPAPQHTGGPTPQGTCVECLVFAVVIAVVAVVSIAFFYSAYGWHTPARVHSMAGGLPKTIVQRGSRVWHGYGPQLLVCTLGDLSPVTAERLPVDGLCDAIVYTHVQSLAGFDEQTSPNVRALWTQAKTAKRTRFGYSFSPSVLPVQEQELGIFLTKAIQDKSMRVFGMLDARWDNNITNDSYVAFAATLNSTTTKMLPENKRPALMFGVRVNPSTSANGVQFWESHVAILNHVHVLIYQGHNTRSHGDGQKPPFVVTFPSPRLKQVDVSDPTMQDSIAAIDTALYLRTHTLASDICVSITLSAYRFSDTKVQDGKEVGSHCGNATLVAYADACVNGSVPRNVSFRQETEDAPPIRYREEGVLVMRKDANLLDAFDDPGTVAEKLRSAKLALSLSAEPYWNFCLAAFNLEHEDSAGACGHKFARLEVARRYLHGRLKWL